MDASWKSVVVVVVVVVLELVFAVGTQRKLDISPSFMVEENDMYHQ